MADRIKIHTIRNDYGNRWKAGKIIHAWYGNPRNPTKHPYHFNTFPCVSVQSISIRYEELNLHLSGETLQFPNIFVDELLLTFDQCKVLAINDGFDGLYEFLKWFHTDFNGKIIHFTNFKY
jgi:hypothetical protein